MKNFYKPWGDVENTKFDDWWKEHSHLFGATRVEPIKRVSKQPNVLNVAIPLNQPVSQSVKELKALIEEQQKARLKELGISTRGLKSKSASFGTYELTKGVEIRGKTLNEILIMYSIWLKEGKPPVNTDYCLKVVERLRNRPRSNWIPYLLQVDPQPDRKGNLRYDENQLRQVRRYIKKGEQVCRAVSLGQFPGKSHLT